MRSFLKKEFTDVNEFFRNERNAEIGHYGQALINQFSSSNTGQLVNHVDPFHRFAQSLLRRAGILFWVMNIQKMYGVRDRLIANISPIHQAVNFWKDYNSS